MSLCPLFFVFEAPQIETWKSNSFRKLCSDSALTILINQKDYCIKKAIQGGEYEKPEANLYNESEVEFFVITNNKESLNKYQKCRELPIYLPFDNSDPSIKEKLDNYLNISMNLFWNVNKKSNPEGKMPFIFIIDFSFQFLVEPFQAFDNFIEIIIKNFITSSGESFNMPIPKFSRYYLSFFLYPFSCTKEVYCPKSTNENINLIIPLQTYTSHSSKPVDIDYENGQKILLIENMDDNCRREGDQDIENILKGLNPPSQRCKLVIRHIKEVCYKNKWSSKFGS